MSTLDDDTAFWTHTDTSGDCWLWTGRTNDGGYGEIRRFGKTMKVHRYVSMMLDGEIPDGVNVLHSCDTPSCFRPSHLFRGTQQDNVVDMASKDRHGRTKFSNEVADTIRLRVAEGAVQRHLAVEYGVSPSCINKIVKRKQRIYG